ncbi:hypothetical protein BH09VER1_BH09VER1_31940 [soil metagenome]
MNTQSARSFSFFIGQALLTFGLLAFVGLPFVPQWVNLFLIAFGIPLTIYGWPSRSLTEKVCSMWVRVALVIFSIGLLGGAILIHAQR